MTNPRTTDEIIAALRKLVDIEATEGPIRKRHETGLAYEDARAEYFKKYPALREAWDQYQMIEKLYTGKG